MLYAVQATGDEQGVNENKQNKKQKSKEIYET
jgi:hypothetical protein